MHHASSPLELTVVSMAGHVVWGPDALAGSIHVGEFQALVAEVLDVRAVAVKLVSEGQAYPPQISFEEAGIVGDTTLTCVVLDVEDWP